MRSGRERGRALTFLAVETLRHVHEAGGRISLTTLERQLGMPRAQLDRVLAYADDERRGLLGVEFDLRTGTEIVVLTSAGARRVRAER